MSPTLTLIGIDCACDVRNLGLARAEISTEAVIVVRETLTGGGVESVPGLIAEWVRSAPAALLAFDAPLGWPAAMGDTLARHRAGDPVPTQANRFFRRETDRDIQQRFRKAPLEVGADRIARTALSALDLLQSVRAATGETIPVAPGPANLAKVAAIEVYPAGTLLAHGLPSSRYKKADQRAARHRLLSAIGTHLKLPLDTEPMLADADILDAVVCLLAAADFVAGRCPTPGNPALASREGWIWVRDP